MLIPILRAIAISTLLVVIGAASFNFALSGGLDTLICTILSLLAILVLLVMGSNLNSLSLSDGGRRRSYRDARRKSVNASAEDRG